MHIHDCKHESIKFCKRCGVPYCEECGKQWAEKCTQSHYTPYYPYSPFYPYSDPNIYNPYIITYDSTTCDHMIDERR